MLGSPSAREPGDRQIGGAPEKVNGAAFPDEASAEDLEDPIGLHEQAPESLSVLSLVFSGRLIAIEANGVRDFVWLLGDPHWEIELLELSHQTLVECCHRLGLERKCAFAAIARLDGQLMIDEV